MPAFRLHYIKDDLQQASHAWNIHRQHTAGEAHSNTTNKGETRIKKSSDAFLFNLYLDLKLILFINEYNIA